jgi:hypothetical protein
VGEFFEKTGISRSNIREACIVWEKSSRRELPRMAGFEKISSRSYDLPEGKLGENVAPQRSSSVAHIFWKSTASRTRKRRVTVIILAVYPMRNIVWRGRKLAGLRSYPIPSNTMYSGYES